MNQIPADLRLAWRALWARPAFSAIAIVSLALGIGANTAIFSVIESTLLRGLPFDKSDQLVLLRDRQPCCEQASVSPGEYLDYSRQSRTLSGLAAVTSQNLTLTGYSDPQNLYGAAVTPNYFHVLGAASEIGRLMSPAIDKPGGTRVAVLSDATWRSIFAGDPSIVGRDITLNGEGFRVIGVLQPKQTYPKDAQIWISPRLLVPEYVEGQTAKDWNIAREYDNHWLSGIGRVRSGVSLSQARAELETIAAAITRAHPEEKDHHPALFALEDTIVQNVRPALWVLLGSVVLLLLIACANLAGLLLARVTGRTRELAIRVSLGASRWQIVRLLLAESFLLALLGGTLGVGLAEIALRLIVKYSPYDLPAALAPELNARVFLFCLLVTLLSALISGVLPAFRSAQVDVSDGLKEGAKGSVGGKTRRLRHVLISAEIALSVVLLAGASLLVHSFARLLAVNPGFDSNSVLTTRLVLPPSRYGTDVQTKLFWDKLLRNIAALPQVQSAGLLTDVPFDGSDSGSYVQSEGQPVSPDHPGMYANEYGVSPGTFQALHIPVLSGRVFNERDDAKTTLSVVINKAFADKLFPQQDSIGKRIEGGPISGSATIIGVVGSFRHSGLNQPPVPDMFYNYPRYGAGGTDLVIRTRDGSPPLGADLRRMVRGLDSNLPFRGLKPLDSYVSQSLAARKFLLGLLTVFSFLAISLAGIGLYGVLAYSVQQRKQEIGIRMALGAQTGDVLGLVFYECGLISLFGVAAGLLASVWSSSFLKSMLFDVSPTDLLAYAGSILMIVLIAALASMLPALRAAKTDPVSALRYE